MTTKKKAGPRKASTAVRRVATRAKRATRTVHRKAGGMMGLGGQKIHWLKALLFLGAGWYLKPALQSSKIMPLVNLVIPPVNQARLSLNAMGENVGWLEGPVAKGAGLGALAKVLYDSQHSGTIKGVDSLLPFAIGAMADPEPGQEPFGQNAYGSSRWYS